MIKKRWVLLPLLAVAVAGSAWLLRNRASSAGAHGGDMRPEVTVARVLTRKVSDSADFTGRLQAVNTVQVRPRVSGFVESVHFREGALVHKGDVLFQLDARPYQAEVDRLRASQAQAKAELELAYTNQRRAEMLLAQHAIAQQEADRLNTAAQSARAAFDATTAALAAARLKLDFTRVRAPIDGRVSNIRITPGNLVGTGDVLTRVVTVNPVYVYFDVDEQTWLRLDHLRAMAAKAGRKADIGARMGLADERGYPHRGRIDFVDNQLQSDTGTMRLRAVFDNRNGLYTPGLYARVKLQSGPARPRVLVDDRAIGTDLGNQFVYVLDKQNKVSYRKVRTGALYHGLRIVDAGLDGDARVVVNGLQHVRPGVQVKPQRVAMDYRLDPRDRALVEAGARAPANDPTPHDATASVLAASAGHGAAQE